ncbi:MAG: tRNA1(Val) (adenine(37)-N6)-methyltransferase [Bacteroidota bacterium]
MKSGIHFHFKQFTITHAQSTHKVGTDGVLLGAWARVADAGSILDIGTGSGLIALMLAQRTPSNVLIDAVEIEHDNAAQAKLNIQQSPWKTRVTIYDTAIQQFDPGKKYDLIVSNPPYFINSHLPPGQKRSRARHTNNSLTFQELAEAAVRLLQTDGTLCIILPYEEGLLFTGMAHRLGLHLRRECSFKARKQKPIERLLLEFSRSPGDIHKSELVLYEDQTEWSKAYKDLTRDFYLKL